MKLWSDLKPAEKVARWEGVLRVLKGLTPHQRRKHFDMSDWLYKTECGTVGCAAGHCALDPAFRRQGFKAKWYMYDKEHADFPGEGFFEIPDVDYFFGWDGSGAVFYQDEASYGETVKNVKKYIKELKDQK